MSEQKTLVVIGGGAAGFFCAVNAAKMNPNLKVIIVEKHNKVLSKVRVSGGGRCNVTHACFDLQELVKKYPRGQQFLKKAFHWFNTTHTIEWFKERNVELKTESDGRMFPVTNSSETIIECLMREANKYNVEILLNRNVERIEITEAKQFKLLFSNLEFIDSDFLCIATGGYHKSTMFNWLLELKHTIAEPLPSLFTFNIPNSTVTELMGVSVDKATVKINGTKLSSEGPVLITHWGMSGPAILKLSAFAARELAGMNYDFSINVNWLSSFNEQTLRNEWQLLRQQFASQKIIAKNPFQLPNRLWQYLLKESNVNEEVRWSDITTAQQNKLIQILTAQVFQVKGKTTFKEEFVTCGGITLSEVDVNTMQSKIIPHLFFAGEVLDVDGITGGFNFQNAWTTGYIAAKTIAALAL
ncbi:MAG: aminoacetone oxidase family FAD-binding enzyme [Chitinophaga sp.]|nr:aminoacetone oxidase family FAD-binding enzyme [Chitinophaga sp.]